MGDAAVWVASLLRLAAISRSCIPNRAPRDVYKRQVHIHIKVRWAEQGVHRTFTSQLYFPDALSDRIYAEPPYAHRGTRDRLNAQDGIFSAGGDQLMLNLAEEGSGFRTRFGIAMLDAIGQP